MKIENYLICNKCKSSDQNLSKLLICCNNCGSAIKIVDQIPRYVDGKYHSNFGLQWNKFSKVQLDSLNGSNESENRLRIQSKLDLNFLSGKTILEVGAGNGRFTEIFLKYGASVISVDYSLAIDANLLNHEKYNLQGKFYPIQADLFNLPFKAKSFDMVFCYGVIQHTGDNKRAILELSKYPSINGRLFIDIYSNGIKHFNPLIYIIRPIFTFINFPDNRRLEIVEKFVKSVFPLQLKTLSFLHGRGGIYKLLRYIVNRSPNSVYGINLYLDGKIKIDTAYQWCVMDTFDAWAPKHDNPVSKKRWVTLIAELVQNGFKVDDIGISGQGHTASLTRL
jgi:SAM-dependent methyltransferase